MELTPENLKATKFKGPVAFYDGAGGMARQDFQSVDNERFGYAWERKDRKDKGRQFYMVDGQEVADFEEACKLLALPADPNSPAEIRKREWEYFLSSPQMATGPYRAQNEAECNADAGPFGAYRSWMQRADNAWHRGINALSDAANKTGEEWPRWLYDTKHAAHETYRGMYLFHSDRKSDTGLECALGKRCRDCPILQQVEQSMVASRTDKPFPREIDDIDIDTAKVWTCIGHVLTSGDRVVDGAFFSIEAHRKDRGFF